MLNKVLGERRIGLAVHLERMLKSLPRNGSMHDIITYHVPSYSVQLLREQCQFVFVPSVQFPQISWHISKDGICIHKKCTRPENFSHAAKILVDLDDFGVRI
jgi:hypothetical protein